MFWLNKKKKLLFSYHLSEIKNELKKNSDLSIKESDLSAQEQKLLAQIKERTVLLNKNNITRTQAYIDFYERHSDIHWAFLAHMVSRNSGWNMTDLKGDLLFNILSDTEQQDLFAFLERGNWLIFQDVYPQLLLYEESKRQSKNLFHLLPYLNVSIFMKTIWDYYWKYHNHSALAIAIVINEQSYIEKRVIQTQLYQESVLEKIEFKLQDLLSLNHILFPFAVEEKAGKTRLIGQTVHHFNSLNERILLGKRLYSILFGNEERLRKVFKWAKENPHTGSRKDFWPHLFHDIRISISGAPYKRKVENCQLKKDSTPIYSPILTHAWNDTVHKEAEVGDWFDDVSILEYLKEQSDEEDGEITDEYCKTLEKIELAIIAQKIFDD